MILYSTIISQPQFNLLDDYAQEDPLQVDCNAHVLRSMFRDVLRVRNRTDCYVGRIFLPQLTTTRPTRNQKTVPNEAWSLVHSHTSTNLKHILERNLFCTEIRKWSAARNEGGRGYFDVHSTVNIIKKLLCFNKTSLSKGRTKEKVTVFRDWNFSALYGSVHDEILKSSWSKKDSLKLQESYV